MDLRIRRLVKAARNPRATLRRIGKSRKVRRLGGRILRETQPRAPVPPVLSVVVPVYNVEDYLAECLDSLVRQSLKRIEIIVVNDGSTDRSAQIAREYATRHSHLIRIIDQPNAGLGAARNTGIAAARGRFLTFVDSDDIVPKSAYKAMIQTLNETGSDFVVGSVQRQRQGELLTTSWVRKVHDRDRLATTIDAFPAAAYDCIACNKVFRTDFFREKVGGFPEGTHYEDQVPSARAYLAARSFDVLAKVTYHWRIRVSGTSITQMTGDLQNLQDRLTEQRQVNDMLKHSGKRAVRLAWLSDRVLGNDVTLYTRDIDRADESYWQLLRTWIQTLFDEDDWQALPEAKASKRVLGWLIAHSSRENVAQFVDFERQNPGGFPTEQVDGTVYAALPFRGQPDPGVPDELYAMSEDQFELDSSVREIGWIGPRQLQITAWAYLRFLNLDDLPSSTTIILRNRRTGEERTFPVTQRTDLRVTERVRHTWMPYDKAGFSAILDVSDLFTGEPADNDADEHWQVWARVTTGGITKEATLTSAVTNGSARMPMASLPVGGTLVLPEWRKGVLTLRPLRALAVADEVSIQDRVLRLAGTLPDGATEGQLSLGGKLHNKVFAARSMLNIQSGHFTAEIALPTVTDFGASDLVNWKPRILVGGVTRWISWATADVRTMVDGNSGLRVRRTLHGNLAVEERPYYLAVDDVTVDEQDLIITGQATGVDLRSIVLVSERSELPAEMLTVAEGVFTARTSLCRRGWGDKPLAMPVGNYSVVAHYTLDVEAIGGGQSPARKRRLLADRPLIAKAPLPLRSGSLLVSITRKQETRLQVKPPLSGDEASAYHQSRLQRSVYEPARTAPREQAVLFEAFKGQYASCNPLAICEELQRRGTDLTLYWSVTDLSVPVPDGTIPLIKESEQWYEKLGRVRYLVNNNNFPRYFRKAPEQVYLQTWHGTPLKQIGHDIHRILFSYRNYLDMMDREAATWDYLISPNEFSTEIFPRAFAYDGPLLESGYPRNDVLVTDEETSADRARSRLGIPSDKRVLLYAPTWRDDQFRTKPGEYQTVLNLDIPKVQRDLDDEFVVLVRGHSNTLAHGKSVFGEGVIDVTLYPDVNDLYSVADVLVTDYSSVMFDYAVTSKPILYLVPDLEDYRDRIRGFYFDFENEAPGPLLVDTAQVVDALRDLDEVKSEYAARYADFRSRFNALEDGRASERVVDAVFGQQSGS